MHIASTNLCLRLGALSPMFEAFRLTNSGPHIAVIVHNSNYVRQRPITHYIAIPTSHALNIVRLLFTRRPTNDLFVFFCQIVSKNDASPVFIFTNRASTRYVY